MSSPPAWSLAGRLGNIVYTIPLYLAASESGKNSALDNPGPGSYNIRDNKIFSNNTSFRFDMSYNSKLTLLSEWELLQDLACKKAMFQGRVLIICQTKW